VYLPPRWETPACMTRQPAPRARSTTRSCHWASVTFVELKTDTGKLTDAQESWAELIETLEEGQSDRLGDPGVVYFVWRPVAVADIADYLQRGER